MADLWTVRRSVTDAKLTGLCGGVAQHWNIDPLLVRVGCALLTLCGGIGLVAYVGGWLFVPQEGQQHSLLDDLTHGATARWPREARLAVVVVAAVVVFGLTSPISPIGFWPVVVVAAIWYFGFYRRRDPRLGPSRDAAPPAGQSPASLTPPAPFRYPGPPTPFTEAAEAWQRRMAEHVSGTAAPPSAATTSSSTAFSAPAPAVPTSQPVAEPWPVLPTTGPRGDGVQDPVSGRTAEHAAYLAHPDPVGLYADPDETPSTGLGTVPSRRLLARSRPARRLRLVALVVAGLTLSGLGVADALGAGLGLTDYLATALLVVGLTLIAATWLGRARGLLPVGVLLLVALLGVSVAGPGAAAHEWTQTRTYTATTQLPAGGDRFQGGSFDVDLTGLRVRSDTTYTAAVEWGELEVRVPTQTDLRIRYRVDQGAAFDGDTALGSGATGGTVEPTTPAAGAPVLTLDLSARFGAVRVLR